LVISKLRKSTHNDVCYDFQFIVVGTNKPNTIPSATTRQDCREPQSYVAVIETIALPMGTSRRERRGEERRGEERRGEERRGEERRR
jgi:hypothetical protein